jgi:hypothetical protein
MIVRLMLQMVIYGINPQLIGTLTFQNGTIKKSKCHYFAFVKIYFEVILSLILNFPKMRSIPIKSGNIKGLLLDHL